MFIVLLHIFTDLPSLWAVRVFCLLKFPTIVSFSLLPFLLRHHHWLATDLLHLCYTTWDTGNNQM